MELRNGIALRPLGTTLAELEQDLLSNLYYRRGTTVESASAQDAYETLALTVRDRLAERRARTAAAQFATNPRWVYYLSAEYLLGPQLEQNLLYSGSGEAATGALKALGFTAEEVKHLDVEPGLGNGGLGRLAACLLDAAGHPRHPRGRLRHPVRLRHLQADLRRRRAGRATRRLGVSRAIRGSSRPSTTGRWSASTAPRRRCPGRRRGAGGRPARWCSASPATCWCPATAPKRSTSSGSGGPGAARRPSTSAASPPASTRRPSRTRSTPRTSARSSTPTTAPSSAGSCA